jgi:hypothetical protein
MYSIWKGLKSLFDLLNMQSDWLPHHKNMVCIKILVERSSTEYGEDGGEGISI